MSSVPEKKLVRHRAGHRHARRRWPACLCGWDFWKFVLAALSLVWEIVNRK